MDELLLLLYRVNMRLHHILYAILQTIISKIDMALCQNHRWLNHSKYT